ncbi:hypothetical protein TWF281_002739 [Arthrobotrys megalospora]
MPEPTIQDRLWVGCPSITQLGYDKQIIVCDNCAQFVMKCCHHPNECCHYYRLVFADGACSGNGFMGARAGVGIALGVNDDNQLSKPFSALDGAESRRTSQVAELRAAREAVNAIDGLPPDSKLQSLKQKRQHKRVVQPTGIWIIAMDSEYVVKGMTEWLPKWKANGMRTAQGKLPVNIDLFLSLEESLSKVEESRNVEICFWYIPRAVNKIADKLAKDGAKLDMPTTCSTT